MNVELNVELFGATNEMPRDRCIVCGNLMTKDPSMSMHRFPSDERKKQEWFEAFGIREDTIVCVADIDVSTQQPPFEGRYCVRFKGLTE